MEKIEGGESVRLFSIKNLVRSIKESFRERSIKDNATSIVNRTQGRSFESAPEDEIRKLKVVHDADGRITIDFQHKIPKNEEGWLDIFFKVDGLIDSSGGLVITGANYDAFQTSPLFDNPQNIESHKYELGQSTFGKTWLVGSMSEARDYAYICEINIIDSAL